MSPKKNYPDIIFTDLDGTLFDSDHRTVLPGTAEAIKRLRLRGSKFVPSSGRAESFIPTDQIPDCDFIMSCNGAVVSDSAGNIIFDSAIPVSNRCALWERLKPISDELGSVFELFCGKDVYFEKEITENLDRYVAKMPQFHVRMLRDGKAKYVESFGEIIENASFRVNKINLPRPTEEENRRVFEVLSSFDSFSVTSSGKAIEIMDYGCCKGKTAMWLAAYTGADIGNCVAFGDAYNDIELLNIVGYGVAMGNSRQAVLDSVKYRTAANTEEGISKFLNRTFE